MKIEKKWISLKEPVSFRIETRTKLASAKHDILYRFGRMPWYMILWHKIKNVLYKSKMK